MRLLAVVVAMLLAPLLAPAQNNVPQQSPNLALRLQPGKLVNGVPDTFTFTFVNLSSHEIRMPLPSKCIGSDNGALLLNIEFTAPGTAGAGGGCGGGINGSSGGYGPKILEEVKKWEILEPNKSLSITYSRQELFATQQAPGRYDFWAEYIPRAITAEDQQALIAGGIDFPRMRLTSPHLVFTRK